jgi:hypothetical protein
MKRTVCRWIDIVCARPKPRCYTAGARTGVYVYVQMEMAVVLAVNRIEGRKKVGTLYL